MTSSTNSDRAISLLLVAAAIAGSFWFACVTPFPALAVVAAYALAPRAALLAVIGAWIANQAVGFNFLGYPQDANTILWGLAIGGGAAVATLLAAEAMRRASPNRAIATVTGFAIAFATYEALLFLASFGLGGAGGFAPSVVGQFALLNLAWTAGLIGILELSRYGRAIGKGAPTPAP